MIQTNPKRRKILQLAGLAVTAGLLLVIGGFVGAAFADDSGADSQPADQRDDTQFQPSSEGGPGGESVSGFESQSSAPGGPRGPILATDSSSGGRADPGVATSPEFINRCQGDIGAVVSGQTIDPALAGFEANFLSSGYVLQSLNFRANAECDDPTQQFLVMETSWQTEHSLFQIWITQRESDEPGANILRESWAEFWHDGYFLSVSVSVNQFYDVKTLRPELDSDGAPIDSVTIEPLFVENSAEVRALLRDVIEELTGDATFQCFYQQIEGGWDSLPELGIGDPRSAVPSGFTEAGVHAQIFEAPSSDCDVPTDVQLPTSFNANWTDGRDGWLSFSIYQVNKLYAEEFAFGRSSDWSVSWTDGTFQYELYGNRDGSGIGLETLEAMAVAIDSAFDQSCRLVEREFSQADLATVGVGWPKTPGGYTLTETHTSGTVQTGTCDADFDAGFFQANWTFESESGAMLYAGAWLGQVRGDSPVQEGYIGFNDISWQSVDGVSYSVKAWNDGDDNRDAMVALAKSLDPGIDIDSFNEGGGRDQPPVALPAGEDSAGSGE